MSSIKAVVPKGRVPPTAGKTPLRIPHHLPYSAGSVVKCGSTYILKDRRVSMIAEILAWREASSSALVSNNSAVRPSPVVSLTDARDFLSRSSQEYTGACLRIARLHDKPRPNPQNKALHWHQADTDGRSQL